MELLHGIDPRSILRTYNEAPGNVVEVSAIPRMPAMTPGTENAIAVMETAPVYRLTLDACRVDVLSHLIEQDLDYYPQEMMEDAKEFTIPTKYFNSKVVPLYSFQFIVTLARNKIQPIHRRYGYTTYSTSFPTELKALSMPDLSSHYIRSASQRVRTGTVISKDAMKNLPVGCLLCELLQTGNASLKQENNNERVWRLFTRFRSDYYPMMSTQNFYPSVLRDPAIDAMFSSPKEIWERDFKMYERLVCEILDSPSSMYTKIGDNLFEIFQTNECEECGTITIYAESIALHVKEEILKKQGLSFHDEVPPFGTDVDKESDNGESYEIHLCEHCDNRE